MLQLCDGRQSVLPLLLYRSSESESDCLVVDGEVVIGNNSVVKEGHIVSSVDECDRIVDFMFVANGSEDELWEFNERSMTWEKGGEPLVVFPLAIEVPLELEYNLVKEIECKGNIDSHHLSQWVTNQIKAFRKFVGTYLEGFEEQITGLLLSIEARKKNKQHVVGDQKKLVISR